MPTTTNPTPAEIARLERDIAEGVMGWAKIKTHPALHRYHKDINDSDAQVRISENVDPESRRYWSPWNDERAALKVLERLQEIDNESGEEPQGYYEISQFHFDDAKDWGISFRSEVVRINGGLQHIGPTVCELARKVIEKRQ